MLRRVGPLRHGIVGLSVAGMATLGTIGVIGAGDDGLFRPEHFDAKQVTVRPAGGDHPDGLRIREVVDIDFGNQNRRGYQRIIPNDFGEATDVVASSPDANDRVNVVQIGNDTRIGVGDPGITFTGRHRYEVEYVLPDAGVTTGELALDVIGTDETLRTDRFEIVVAGFESLTDVDCVTGGPGAVDGCALTPDGEVWTAVIEPLDPGEGITIYGAFTGVDAGADAPPVPAIPDRGALLNWPLGLAIAALGAAAAAAIFVTMRRRGSNVVFGEGAAADAALGVPLPNPGLPVHDVVTHRVPDDRLADYATIEFVPPRGLEPWQGAALLRERVDDTTIRAWFGEMIARGTITTTGEGTDMELHRGPADATLSERDQRLLRELFRHGDTVPLGTYRKSFANLWTSVRETQSETIDASGWWERPIATSSFSKGGAGAVLTWAIVLVAVFAGVLAPLFAALAVFVRTWWSALALAVLVIAAIAALAYRAMLASRTATGSALTLRTESFRRFLAASEGKHVDWAWEQGILREYSAWAVALGAADVRSSAIRASAVPDRDVYLAGPLVMHHHTAAFSSTTTAPSSSGGGGGFGGGVGGGGGGGSSGSW